MKRTLLIILAVIIVFGAFASVYAEDEKTGNAGTEDNNSVVIAGIIVTCWVTVRLLIQQKKIKEADKGNDKTNKM